MQAKRESRVRLSSHDSITSDAIVCHYDELSDTAQDDLFSLVRDDSDEGRLGLTTATELTQYDFVKFTKYYRIDWA
jgi:hypothetical protein